MKKITLLMLILSTSAISGYCQETSTDLRDAFLFGIKAGANFSNVYDTKNEAFNTSGKTGLAAGMFFDIPLGTIIGIQPEVLYSEKGFTSNNTSYSFTRTSGFIDIPVFLAIKPSEFLTVLAGPQYSYQVNQKDVYNNGNTSITEQQQFSNDNIRKNILSFACGFDLNFQHFIISGRADWDVQDNNGNGSVTNPVYKNVWYQATLGYRF